jgi:hypothetical protein
MKFSGILAKDGIIAEALDTPALAHYPDTNEMGPGAGIARAYRLVPR